MASGGAGPTPPADMLAWSRRQLTGVATAAGLAVLLVAVRLAAPSAAVVAAGLGYCVALVGLVASFLVRRLVRALNERTGLDRERARRIGEATRARTAVEPQDAPAARAVYGVGIAEWTRFAWAFTGATHLGLGFGLTPATTGIWTLALGLVIAVSSAAFAAIAVLSVLRLRAQLRLVPDAWSGL